MSNFKIQEGLGSFRRPWYQVIYGKIQAHSYVGVFGVVPQFCFVPQNFVVPRKISFKHITKTKILPH